MMSKVINLKANNSSIYDDITKSYFSYYNGPFPVELHKTPFGKEEYMYKSNGYVYLSTPSNIQSIIRNLESFTISFWTILTSSTVGTIISFASSSVYRYGFFISTIFNIYIKNIGHLIGIMNSNQNLKMKIVGIILKYILIV